MLVATNGPLAVARLDERHPPSSAMVYYEVPADVAEDLVQLAPWMRKAIDVAAQAKGKHKGEAVIR